MRTRSHTFQNILFQTSGCVKKSLLFLILLLPCFVFSQADVGAIKKEATRLFEDEDYAGAYKLYSQLVANYPKDPEYNYKLGVCMIFAEPDKKKCLPYLLFAKRNTNDETKDVAFWLGKANHINYLFDEAIKNYEEFKQSSSAAKQKKLQVDREIQACNNGKLLLSNLTDLEVTAKKELNEADYFRTYDLRSIGGKLLVKPDEFKSSTDKKKKDHSVVYLPSGSNRVYYSSYGDDPANGRDIYFSVKMADGSYSKGEKVKGINTPFDEDYPFLHPNGLSLYFASKGHNSMGGYDIFRSTYIEGTDSWSAPVNLEFPINSPDDDFLFVTDSLEKTAWFSTGRQSPPGKTDVLKINTERKPIDVLVIGGNVLSGIGDQSRKSVINVKKANGEGITRTYNADDNGDYNLEVANGAKLIFTVETPGMKTQSKEIEMPLATSSRPMRQTIGYEKGELVITNYFDETPKSGDYLQYLKVIEKKAKLEVNEGQNALSANASSGPAKSPRQKGNAPQIVDQSSPESAAATTTTSGMDNKQLSAIAKKDAQDLQEEANRLKQDARDALEVGTQQKEDADKKLIAADSQLQNAENISNADEKKQAIDEADKLKQQAQSEAALAEKILAFGKSLDQDAAIKQQEAQLNDSYAKELDKAISSKNTSTATTTKLEELQKQIASLSEQNKQSDELLNGIRSEMDQKEKRIKTLEQANSDTQLSLNEIKTQIGENDAELEKTRKKKDKEVIITQTNDLKAEQNEKEILIAKNEEEIKRIGLELDALKNEADLTNRIKTENIAPAVAPATLVAAVSSPTPAAKNNKQNQTVAANTKAATKKQTTTTPATATKNDALPDYTPLSANNYSEAVTRLDKLDQQLNNSVASDRELFDYNGYQSPQAQAIRTEADTRMNEATLQQKNLKETITGSKEELKPVPASTDNKITPGSLSKEADDLAILAQSRRTEAAGKEGAGKDSLMTAAKDLDAKAEEKYLQAASLTGNDNKAVFDNNAINILKLSEQNKASEFELATAKKLNEEAAISFKQATAIRDEAASLNNNGAKLGSYSNAEEIEATAIAKQNEAIALLRKTSPDLPLSEAVTSGSQPAVTTPGADAVASGLTKVNSGVNDLAAAKLQSYQKLFEANAAEIDQLNSNISANQSVLDKTPGLKSEYAASSAKLKTVNELRQKSEDATAPGDKLNNLGLAIKKQIEVLKQLSKVNTALDKIVAANTAVAKQDNNTTTAPATATTLPESATGTVPAITETVSTEVASNNTPTETVTADVIVPASLSGSDTTSAQLLGYLEKNPAVMKNASAETAVKKAVEDIRTTAEEISRIEEKIRNYEPGNVSTVETPSQLKGRADALLIEAETLSGKAFQSRKSAEEKSGPEKDSLIAAADLDEKQSETKKLEASALTQEANNKDYESNKTAISELIAKLKNDDPVKAAELEAKNNETETLHTQTKQLREEANSMSSTPARLGALSNAEEKEAETTQKQNVVLEELKKAYPDYVMKSAETAETPESLQAKKSQLLEKQYTDLTNLTNSYSLEYESGKGTVASRLNTEQTQVQQNAEALSSESKNLLIKAAGEPNSTEKIKLLTLAAKTANAAVTQLNKLPAQKAVAAKDDKALKAIGDGLNGKTRPNNKRPATETATASNNPNTAAVSTRNRGAVRIEGLEVLKGNAYNDDRPIPVDAKMEDGLVFRVQIGAFRTRLPNNAFRGLSPLNGETAGNGYIRYTAGNFNKIENANAVKNDLRKLGYSDAFVVVYYNGRRITLAEALEIMNKEGKTIDTNAPQTAGITANANIPKATTQPATVPPAAQDKVIVAQELEQINGLLFTVQIGVYTKEVTSSRLLNLKPIFTEKLNNGLFRYTVGIYNNADRLITDKNKVVLFGVKDAFVSAYLNGKRIPFSEGKTRQAEDSTIKTLPEDPIVFPAPAAGNENTSEQIAPTSTVQPFRNEVTTYPAATDSNGVKSTEDGITFKVQIGAYSKQVPEDVALKFSEIKSWPVENKQVNGLFIYNIGNFSAPSFAKALKEEVVKIGITDAFITVYRNGIKLYGTEAASLMSR